MNIPIADDYDSIIAYLISPHRISQLFAQHNEHRLAFTRLVAGLSYRISGKLDFANLIFTGSMALVFMFLLLMKILRERNLSVIFLVPAAYLLFNAQYWENMTWATTALNNYIFLFGLLSVYCWSRKTLRGYVLSIIFAIMATYTAANGIIIFFTLLTWETSSIVSSTGRNGNANNSADKSRLRFFLLAAVTACICCLYFICYQKPSHHPDILATLLRPGILVEYLLLLIGSYVGNISIGIALLSGLIEIIFLIVLTFSGYRLKNHVIYYFLLFMFLTLFSITMGRAGFGIEQALSPRYRIFSLITLITLYIALLESHPGLFSRKPLISSLIILSMAFNVVSTVSGTKNLSDRKTELINGLAEWKRTGRGLYYPDQERASLLMEKAIKSGIYYPPGL